MARLPLDRDPAQPSSPDQRERYDRILAVAVRHATATPLERVQMQEIAREAGVAIATLYRYFPSKTQLFHAVRDRQLDRLAEIVVPRTPEEGPADAVIRLLLRSSRGMLERPMLTRAIMHANADALAGSSRGRVIQPFRSLLLQVARLEHPSDLDERLIRLIEQVWYGILFSALNGHVEPEQAEDDLRLACERLLVGFGAS